MKTFLLLTFCLIASVSCDDGVIFCYWGAWSNGRLGAGSFGVSDLPTDLCTHVVYSFIGLTAEGDITLPEQSIIGGKSSFMSDFVALKQQNEDLKMIVAIGGWSEGSENFSIVSNNETLRGTFVTNLLDFVRREGFDGLDMDWEYPAQRGGNDTDKEAFVLLLRDLKEAFNPYGLLLTAAVSVTQYNIDLSYDVPGINEYLDYINLMSYDFHGSWDNTTGVNAPLYPQIAEDTTNVLNVNAAVNVWINNGASPSKLVLGLATYGRTFNLTSLSETGVGAPASGPGAPGTYTLEAGFMAYYEICQHQQNFVWNITEVDENYVFGNSDHLWVGYDNVHTIRAKGAYAKERGLAGIMYWAIDLDDFSGLCHNTTFELIKGGIEGYKHNFAIRTATSVVLLAFMFCVNMLL